MKATDRIKRFFAEPEASVDIDVSNHSEHIGPALSLTSMGMVDVYGRVHLGLDDRGALMSSDFIACETEKIRSIRSLPVHIMKRESTGRKPADDHPLSKLLRRPNPLMSWGDLIAWAILWRDIKGTAYIRVSRGNGYQVTGLWPVMAHVDVSFDKQHGVVVYSAGEDIYNPAWQCREDGVVVLKTDVSVDGGKMGKSIAETAAHDIGLSIDLPKFYESVIQNGTHMGGWLEHPDKLSTADITAIRQSLDSQKGVESAGGTRIFDRGLKYHEVSMAIGDLSIVDQERFILEKVCRACHVNPDHVYSGAGNANSDISYVKQTVLPEIVSIEEAFQVVLDGAQSIGGKDSGFRLKFDTNGLLRGDFKTRMEGYRIGVYAGIFSRAYCCTQEDIPWLPGQDKLLQPTAYYMVDENGDPYVPAAATDGTSGQSDGVSGIDPKVTKARLQAVIDNALDRIEVRAANDGAIPKTYEFAEMVTAPIVQCALAMGEVIDFDVEIEDAIQKGISHE